MNKFLDKYCLLKSNQDHRSKLNRPIIAKEIENALLSEVTQTQKEEYGIYSLISEF